MAVLDLARKILDDTRSWGDQANCIGQAAVLEGDDINAAKKLCLGDGAGRPRCPVIDACHAWVIPLKGKNDPGGVRAGRTEDERNDFRRGRPPGHLPNRTNKKKCRGCGKTKPGTEFTRHRRHSDGLGSYCKPCEATRQATKNAAKEAAA
jgi:hypothetical protein